MPRYQLGDLINGCSCDFKKRVGHYSKRLPYGASGQLFAFSPPVGEMPAGRGGILARTNAAFMIGRPHCFQEIALQDSGPIPVAKWNEMKKLEAAWLDRLSTVCLTVGVAAPIAASR